MHEASLARNILEIVESYSDQLDGKSLKTVTIRIGELTGIYTESLEFYYKEITKGTLFEGSVLLFEHCPIKGRCRNCKNEFEIKSFELNCPQCNSTQFDIIGGAEFEIMKMEIE